MNPSQPTLIRQQQPDVKPRPVPQVGIDDLRLREMFLSKYPLLDRQNKAFAMFGSKDEFWKLREVIQSFNTVRYEQMRGIPSEMLFDQQPIEQNNQKIFKMTKEIKEQIFRQYPEVEYAYQREVPKNRGEVPFWTLFFKCYVSELREDNMLGDVNFFANYKREIEAMRTHPKDVTDSIRLEISVEDCSNEPKEYRKEVYEPIVNDGVLRPLFPPDLELNQEFIGLINTVSRHTGLIDKLIRSQASAKSDVTRELAQNTEAAPGRVAQHFSQQNYVNYDEQMRRRTKVEDGEAGRCEVAAVTDSERVSFAQRMTQLNPRIANCMNRHENSMYVLEQMQKADKEGQNSMDLRQHNLIPADAQPIVESVQLQVNGILHLAWYILQNRTATPEIKRSYFQHVRSMLISLM